MLHLVSVCLCCYKVPDPDLEIRGGGGRVGTGLKKFCLKIRGGPGLLGPLPGIRHCYIMMYTEINKLKQVKSNCFLREKDERT